VTDFPVRDNVKGTPYEKMKLKPGDKETIERRARVNKIKPRRIDVDESVSPMRQLARKLVEMVRHGDKD
jgi:hypothetical protein